MQFETVVGLETHVELIAQSKVFTPCIAEFGGEPNTHTDPITLGLPGTLPVLNRASMEMALQVALALDCEIPEITEFDRKNYYYPDLPKNYQISQEHQPLARNGRLTLRLKDGGEKTIGIHNIHLEEDAGKNIHQTRHGKPVTLVDLNRAGTSLLEIVSQPDLRSLEETEAFMRTLRNLLRYIEVSDCKMQEGSLRFELNISVRPQGQEAFGTKVEIKNVGSIKAVLKAYEYEYARQTELIEDGGQVVQETRLWDDDKNETRSMRVKEGAKDYRYFPEPDLPLIRLERDYLNRLKAALPELRDAKRRRFEEEYDIPDYDAEVIAADRKVADFFDACCQLHDEPKTFSNWIMTYVLAELKDEDSDISDLPVSPAHFAELAQLIAAGKINTNIAKKIMKEMLQSGGMPAKIVEEQGLEVVSDSGELEKWVEEVIAEQPGPVEEYKNGKDNTLNFLLGQVMKKSRGKASPDEVKDMLSKKIRG